MTQSTINTAAFIEAQQYSQFIIANLHDGLIPEQMSRNVSDFGTGTTLNIKTVGATTIQEVAENTPMVYSAIDTGTVNLSITDYVGVSWSVTDVLRQDGSQIETLMAMQAQEATRAIQEYYETRFFAVANAAQTPADPNNFNGFAHRLAGSGTNDTMDEDDLISLRLAFDKANVPEMGRVGIVDPVVAATFQKKVILTGNLDMNPTNQMLLENGFDKNHRFVLNLFGWNIWTSNRLPVIASETISGNTVTNGVANIFMCIADDNCKPVMSAWRQQPTTETYRDYDRGADKFLVRCRFGLGVQRIDTLGVIVTSATATA